MWKKATPSLSCHRIPRESAATACNYVGSQFLFVFSGRRTRADSVESIDDYATPELEAAWDDEIERRVKDIQSGEEKGIPAEDVMKEARRALNETRRLPSARRK